MAGEHHWVDEQTLEIDGVTFVAALQNRFTSSPDRFCLVKHPALVRKHLALLEELRPRRVVELGIFQGGSAALLALTARPDIHLAIERSEKRIEALDVVLERAGLQDNVRACFGVDQGDRAAVGRLLDEAGLTDRSLDLVIDDASHLIEPTRASFNQLFPLLRPGGLFVIEDWAWAHVGWNLARPNERPLTDVVFEITLAVPSKEGVIAEVRIDREWAVVVRGEADVDPETFDISACYGARGRALLTMWSEQDRTSSPA